MPIPKTQFQSNANQIPKTVLSHKKKPWVKLKSSNTFTQIGMKTKTCNMQTQNEKTYCRGIKNTCKDMPQHATFSCAKKNPNANIMQTFLLATRTYALQCNSSQRFHN